LHEISPHIGREQVVEALGRRWKLARWDRGVWKDLLEWARPQVPDPIEAISKHLDKLPPEVAKYAVDAALKAKRAFLSINSPEVQTVLGSLEGISKALYLLLLPHQPNATEDDAYAILMEVGPEEMQKRLAVALGRSESAGNAVAPGGQ